MTETGSETTGLVPVEPISRETFRQAITDIAVEFAGEQTSLLRPGMITNRKQQEALARDNRYYGGLATVAYRKGRAYALRTGLELLGQKSLVQMVLADAQRVSAADVPLEAGIEGKYSLQINYPLSHEFFEEMVRRVGFNLQMVDQVLSDPQLSVAAVGTNSKELVERKGQEGRAKGYTTILEKLEQGWTIVEAAEAAEKVMKNAKK